MRISLLAPLAALTLLLACGDASDDPNGPGGAASSSGASSSGAGGAGSDGGTSSGGSSGGEGGFANDAASDGPPMPEPTGYFVAVGYGGRRLRSADTGATWQNDQSDIPNGGDDKYLMRDVGWGGGQWLTAGGFNGNIKTSPNAITWTTQAAPIGQWFGGVAFGNGIWVAVGGTGRRSSSTNGGATWVDKYDSGAQNGYRALAYGPFMGHRWVGVGDGGRATHTADGVTWGIGSGVPGGYDLNEVAYGNGVFVALVGNGSNNYVRSTDGGATWVSAQLPTGAKGIAFGKGRFVIVGSGQAIESTDGAAWTQHAAAGLDGCVAYGNGTFVALTGTRTLTSSDGVAWSSKTNVAAGNYIVRVRFGGTP